MRLHRLELTFTCTSYNMSASVSVEFHKYVKCNISPNSFRVRNEAEEKKEKSVASEIHVTIRQTLMLRQGWIGGMRGRWTSSLSRSQQTMEFHLNF